MLKEEKVTIKVQFKHKSMSVAFSSEIVFKLIHERKTFEDCGRKITCN